MTEFGTNGAVRRALDRLLARMKPPAVGARSWNAP
jgi:hypothetical protein